MTIKHVLVIGKVWIEPTSSAAGSRTLQLIEVFLQQAWQVSFATAAGHSEFKADLGALGIQEFNIELNNSSFDDLIKTLKPDIVVFDRFVTEEQFGWRVAEHCPEALRILDTIDLHCLRVARQSALKQNREFTKNDLFNDTSKRELASIYRCDITLMISEVEMALLQNEFKVDAALLFYIPFLLDPISETTKDTWPNYETRRDFISIGNFLHEPNWDAVLYLKNTLWPLIRNQLPEAKLQIYGAYPSQKVFQLNNTKEGFIINGRAESAQTVMEQGRVCLAPLRFGAGIKGKLLDAMLFGTPSVTTPLGAESMSGDLLWNGFIESDPDKFAQAAVNLYKEKSLWQTAQKNGFTIINSFYSKKQHVPPLLEKIKQVYTNLDQHRLNNFTGSMLMQQSLAATKYMALWIEEKNRLKT
jgi:O-antigen biosynthesis protein